TCTCLNHPLKPCTSKTKPLIPCTPVYSLIHNMHPYDLVVDIFDSYYQPLKPCTPLTNSCFPIHLSTHPQTHLS
ncbi:predicted protein, partial [Nematostella vectensis]